MLIRRRASKGFLWTPQQILRLLMISKLIITIETGLSRDSKEGTPLATIQTRRNLQWLRDCGKWDRSTYNSNTIFYKALRGVYLIAILNKTSGCVPLCLNISPSTCLFKSLLLEKAWLSFDVLLGKNLVPEPQKEITHIPVDLLLLIILFHFFL